ncbi:MAG: aminoacyl-histidine dipeptidase [Lachnospiraceae bacterium]|nr:aminoacyl-histidine dipeptidase [Lachnospiraceae bacterium]
MTVEEMCRDLDYKNVLQYFCDISRVPRGSGHNEKISNYLADFAKAHGLRYVQDETLNIIMYKPATPGYENHTPVIIQGHMDMVCVTAPGVEHDFENEPLELFVEDGYLGAKGTTLGGDDGIAVAIGMALLTDDTIEHPALELLITTDEETGMDGAKNLDASLLKGRYMLNLDSEEEGSVLVSCAGGLGARTVLPIKRESASGKKVRVTVSGLKGGHSGAEIHRWRTNALLLLARYLFEVRETAEYAMISMEGGEKTNAIPCLAAADLVVDASEFEEFKEATAALLAKYQNELSAAEPDVMITLTEGDEGRYEIMHPNSFERMLFLLLQAPNGVQAMSAAIEGLVETSLNLGIFKAAGDSALFCYSIRSSVGTAKYFVRDRLAYLAEFMGAEFIPGGEYPAWEYKQNSPLRDLFVRVFTEDYGHAPKVEAIHAGLECGLICEKIPDIDIVSLGPDMRDIHTPKERLGIESTIRVYQFLEHLLAEMK